MMNCAFRALHPVMMKLDAEQAHNLTLKALKSGLFTQAMPVHDPRLHTSIANIRLANPLGLAAGFDKGAECADAMLGFGFGFVELGTVTPRPQAGNPKPRVFRDIPSKSVINRMGFPNPGLDVFRDNVHHFRNRGRNQAGLIGINIGKNKDTQDDAADYLTLIEALHDYADYFCVNISSPNTPGLRNLQDPDHLGPFLSLILKQRDTYAEGTPVFLKLAPDLQDDQITAIAAVCMEAGVDGLILTNTTLARPEILTSDFAEQAGGLSGPLLSDQSTHVISRFYTHTAGRIPIIGIGGIHDAQTAYDKIKAGASALQLYTAMVYQGPAIVKTISKGLLTLLENDGFDTLEQAIGSAHATRMAANG